MIHPLVAPGLLALALVAPLNAQDARSATGQDRNLPLSAVAFTRLARPNLDVAHKEDLQREREGLPPRYALPTAVRITPDESGTWENLGRDRVLWRLRIQAPGASNINLGFGRYVMPEGGQLSIYSFDRVHVVRPFTAADNDAHGELWTPAVATDELVVELALPIDALDDLELELTQIGYGYRGFGARTIAELSLSGSCNVDVVCPEGDDWRLEIPSVGVISTGGSTFCTGYMVNNTRTDLKPYFMTADHCGIGSGNAASLVVYWNYENSFCRVPGSVQSGQPGDGQLSQFNTGSILRAEYSASDMTLVELDDDPDPSFDVSYAGWDATGVDATAAIAIHQPNTDEKRISFEDQPTTVTTYLQNTVPGNGTHVRVEDWDLGTTEPGSSGSPLFDQNRRVIGQLHGGFASCSSQTSDWYGRFSLSWTGGGTASTRLSDWLDPDGTGALTTDTVSLATLCSSEGTVALARGKYGCSDSVEILVVDCDLNTNPATVQTVSVTLDSDSEPGGEAVLLTETGAGTSRFRGTLPISGIDGPGVLLAAEGDTLTANYLDADDGLGNFNLQVTATGSVDCSPPAIQSVSVSAIGPTSAMLTVDADEPIAAGADYGTSCGSLVQSAEGVGLDTTAVVELTGLTPGTTYYVSARGTDEAGNVGTDDNGGGCYSFTTVDVPLYFTEEFLADNDLDMHVVSFRVDPGPDGYAQCDRGTSAGLPTDPTGGTVLSLADDGSALVTLNGGKRVVLYGQSYASFWVNANGNITFNTADGDYTESLVDHFAQPRVSGLFDDLNPSAGGTVSWKQSANRVTVTWQNVPEFSTSNQNTFQIDLLFNGRVRLSYGAVAAADGISGLSGGTGLDPGFVETDLDAGAPCMGGPVPSRTSETPTPVQ